MNIEFSSRHIVSLFALLCAAYIAGTGHDGWGWCIFVALMAL